MAVPEAADMVLPRRNAKATARGTLVIDPGPQSISSRDAAPVACVGRLTGVPVKLGELRTDTGGRLLFLGGHGVSASPTGAPIFIEGNDGSFINANGWYDDTCDGPISATVTVEGRAIPVESAWVMSAPPNYALQLKAAPRDRGGGRCPRPQPYVGAGTPELGPHCLTPNRVGATAPRRLICAPR